MKRLESLPQRDQAIIEHVARYRLSTDDVLHELFFPDARSRETVQKSTSRLIDAGWLDKFQPIARKNIYVLGRNFERSRSQTRTTAAFSEQPLPEAIAILYFCARTGRRRLTVPELRSLDSRLCDTRLGKSPYVVEKLGERFGLSLLCVDRGSPIRRLVWKFKRLVGQRKKRLGYRAWILDARFSVTILTPFPEKHVEILRAFSPSPRPQVPVRAVLVPEYAPYVCEN